MVINLPPMILSTYGLDCRVCGGIVHGSYCASSEEDLRADEIGRGATRYNGGSERSEEMRKRTI